MSDTFNYGPDATGAPDGEKNTASPTGSVPPVLDGARGLPLAGAPDWRAGAFGSGGGLLGMIKVSNKPGGPSSGALPAYETDSWRWNDPEAIAFDLDWAQRSLGEAQGIGNGLELFGGVKAGLGVVPRAAKAAAAVDSAPLALAGAAYGAYLAHIETTRLQAEVKALQSHLDQIKG